MVSIISTDPSNSNTEGCVNCSAAASEYCDRCGGGVCDDCDVGDGLETFCSEECLDSYF